MRPVSAHSSAPLLKRGEEREEGGKKRLVVVELKTKTVNAALTVP